MQKSPGKLLSIYIDRSDRCGDHALFEVIVDRCRDMGIAGATVISGLEGFGETAQIRKKHVTHTKNPW